MFLRNRLHSLRRIAQFCTVQSTSGKAVDQQFRLQFRKSGLTDFGELPVGEIPEALKWDRPSQVKTLENGVRVASEFYGSRLVSLTVAVKAGSRYETLETSGVSNFVQKLNLRGTTSRSREQIEGEIDSLGGQLHVTNQRELQLYSLSVEPENVERAVALLGDLLTNSLYSSAQIEAEREAIYREQVSLEDPLKIITEAAHFTNYRDHQLGQPVLGIRENTPNITDDHIKAYHKARFVGHNVTVAATGNVNHDTLVNSVAKAFGSLSSSVEPLPNSEQPYATHSIMNMRDDELHNLNMGVFFNAPSVQNPDCFAMQFFAQILGDYRADKYTGAHLNSAGRQYNQLHAFLGNLPDVQVQKVKYFLYSDTGLFGNYLVGNEVYACQMAFLTQMVLSEYASFINPVEVFRGRAKIFNQLLTQENSIHQSTEVAQQVTYFGRRVPRSEWARRISAMDAGHLQNVASKWFWDKDISVVMWGPTHLLQTTSHYNRPWKRSTLGTAAMQYYDQ